MRSLRCLSVVGALLFWRSHQDLGRQFSPLLEMKESHVLVCQGIYKRIRHPMYTAAFALAFAQLLLLGNWVAGPAFAVTFLLLYVLRIDDEEKMMLDHFGSEYADYQRRTRRLLPSFSTRK
jgi:protein-S-isoprenylcysteine O-methyltransferase Ste14